MDKIHLFKSLRAYLQNITQRKSCSNTNKYEKHSSQQNNICVELGQRRIVCYDSERPRIHLSLNRIIPVMYVLVYLQSYNYSTIVTVTVSESVR